MKVNYHEDILMVKSKGFFDKVQKRVDALTAEGYTVDTVLQWDHRAGRAKATSPDVRIFYYEIEDHV